MGFGVWGLGFGGYRKVVQRGLDEQVGGFAHERHHLGEKLLDEGKVVPARPVAVVNLQGVFLD